MTYSIYPLFRPYSVYHIPYAYNTPNIYLTIPCHNSKRSPIAMAYDQVKAIVMLLTIAYGRVALRLGMPLTIARGYLNDMPLAPDGTGLRAIGLSRAGLVTCLGETNKPGASDRAITVALPNSQRQYAQIKE